MPEDRVHKSIYYLMLVAEDPLGNVIDRDVDDSEWEKLRQLSQEKRNIVLSDELVKKMMLMQERFRLDDTAVGKINILLRKIFFGELSLAECEAKIGSMLMQMGGGDPNQARAIVEFIQHEILTIKPKAETEEGGEMAKPVTVSMLLLQALSKYPNLGNQLITQERIRIKAQPDPVRPSLLNWLKYYREELGVGFHDNVMRGQFLFHSDNGKRLSAEERERISLVLKSVEDNLPLTIDTERQEIIFPEFREVLIGDRKRPSGIANIPQTTRFYEKTETSRQSQTSLPSETYRMNYAASDAYVDRRAPNIAPRQFQKPVLDDNNLSFSAKHVFPAEKEAAMQRPTPPQPVSQVPQFVPKAAPKRPAQQPSPFRIDPVSGEYGGDNE